MLEHAKSKKSAVEKNGVGIPIRETYTLSECDRLLIENANLRFENASIRFENAKNDFNVAVLAVIKPHIGDAPITEFELVLDQGILRRKPDPRVEVLP